MSDYLGQVNRDKDLSIYDKEKIKKELVDISLRDLEKSDDRNKSYGALLKEVKLFKKTASRVFRLYMRKLIHIVENAKYKEGGYKTKDEFLNNEMKMGKATYYEQKQVYDFYFANVRPNELEINDENFEYSKAKLSIPYLRNLPEDKMRKAQKMILNEMPRRSKIQMREFIKEKFMDNRKFNIDDMSKYTTINYTQKQKEASKLFGDIKEKPKNQVIEYFKTILEIPSPDSFLETEEEKKEAIKLRDKIVKKLERYL